MATEHKSSMTLCHGVLMLGCKCYNQVFYVSIIMRIIIGSIITQVGHSCIYTTVERQQN